MPLTPTEYADVKTAYYDNSDYAEVGSVVKATAFRVACMKLLNEVPTETADRDGNVQMTVNLESVREQLARVNQWLSDHARADMTPAGGRTRYMRPVR